MKIRLKRVRVGLPNRVADRADLQVRRPPALAESVTPQDVVGAVAELLAAAAQVGAMPTCFVTGSVDGEAGAVTVSAWEGDVTGRTIASATAGIG